MFSLFNCFFCLLINAFLFSNQCFPSFLNYQLTSGIRANLNYSWPDAFDVEQNFNFWNRQYYKHGSCTKLIFDTPETYFSLAEIIYRTLDLDAVFSNGGIGPGQPFPTATYMNLVQTAIGGLQPQLLCNGQALREVVLCQAQGLIRLARGTYTFQGKEPNLIG